MTDQIADKVRHILSEASDYVGRYEAECFSQDQFCQITEQPLGSPLEQALWIAFNAVARINFIAFSEPLDTERLSPGLFIQPQRKIGNYRADFFVEWLCWGEDGAKPFRQVVVECDGTAFHERTEAERRYEKQRDRFMQKNGFKVFRYTGKEILVDPYKIAAEIIGYVSDDENNTITPKQYFE